MGFALPDAFNFRRVDRVNLLAALPAHLIVHALDEIQPWAEDRVQGRIVFDLTVYVANYPAQIGLEAALFTAGA